MRTLVQINIFGEEQRCYAKDELQSMTTSELLQLMIDENKVDSLAEFVGDAKLRKFIISQLHASI